MDFQIINKPYPNDNRTKEVLKDCADFVQKDGLNYLVPKWKEYCKDYVDGYDIDDTIYEFLNDLDTRHLIYKTLKVLDNDERAKIEKELEHYDKLFIEWTVELKTCAWGVNNEKSKGYSREKSWYYYRAPQHLIDLEPDELERK
jgi:hypothetical protein